MLIILITIDYIGHFSTTNTAQPSYPVGAKSTPAIRYYPRELKCRCCESLSRRRDALKIVVFIEILVTLLLYWPTYADPFAGRSLTENGEASILVLEIFISQSLTRELL